MLKEPIITPARMLGSGLAAGSLLGIYLKFIEHFTSFNVYTLLLNVDYIPGLNRLELPEWVEFLLHLAISVLLSAVLAQILRMQLLPPARAFNLCRSRLHRCGRSALPDNGIIRSDAGAYRSGLFPAVAVRPLAVWGCIGEAIGGCTGTHALGVNNANKPPRTGTASLYFRKTA